MDFKKIMATIIQSIKSFLSKAWQWLKPYIQKFRKWRKRVWKKYQINKIILLVGLVVVLVTSLYLFYLAKSANVSSLEKDLAEVTKIYDKNGEEAGTLYGQKGKVVTLGEISPLIRDAVISTEDRRFEEHGGFDVRGIGRAALGILKSGGISGGGSTITQQLAKNAFLTQKQTFDRKARELFLAIEIEKNYSKDEILTMYLNNAYFGNGVWGVEDASQKYFGRSAAEVDASEAAVIAGMLKGPGIYNPIDHPENAKNRRNTVLQLMVDNGKLSQEEADKQIASELYLTDNYHENKNNYQYPYYFDAVINEAEELYNIKADDLLNKGYQIYTSLDQNYQQGMQTSFENDNLFPNNAPDGTIVQAAGVAIDPQTGGVAAIVGGRGERVFRGFNRATDALRSPGSTMKPLAVYTPALEAGYKPDTILKDEALPYYDVQNYSRTYSGEVPMYQALAESLNAPAVWLMNKIGVEKGAKKVEQFGINLTKEDHYLGLPLGGLTNGVTPLQMASAYTVFANHGEQKKAHFITKIVDASGAVVVDNTNVSSKQVTTPDVANQMTSMLQGVFSTGTGRAAEPYGFTLAGKTGTTEQGDKDARDQWIIGYTPDVVLATWIGFDNGSDIHALTGSSEDGVSQIFKDMSGRILANSPGTHFDVVDVSQENAQNQENTEKESEKSKNNFGEKVNDFGDKVVEGAEYWGGKIKEGTGKAVDKVSNFWDSLVN